MVKAESNGKVKNRASVLKQISKITNIFNELKRSEFISLRKTYVKEVKCFEKYKSHKTRAHLLNELNVFLYIYK